MNLRGKTFLKITGIIMLASGAVGTIANLIFLFTMSVGSGILGLLSCALMMLCGLLGIRFCNEASKANTCMIMGLAMAGTYLLVSVINMIILPVLVGVQVVGMLFSLALPGLYVLGAMMNLQDAKKMGYTAAGLDFASLKDDVFDGVKGAAGSVKNTVTGEKNADNDEGWTCSCGSKNNTANFCPNCGGRKPRVPTCPSCGWQTTDSSARFCQRCGTPMN